MPKNRHETTESSCSLLSSEAEAPQILDISADLKNDLGYFIDETKSVSEVEQVIRSMQNRANAPAISVQEYFLRNIAIPFIDHVITELETHFIPLSTTSSTLLGLIPSVLCNQVVDISEAVEMYKDDLPSPELIDQELRRWKLKWEGKSVQFQPSSCAQTIKKCDFQHFPNISQLLKLACTLPVTSCECERSASTLRRLNTFMRASMGEERLSALAMIHILLTMTWP